MKLAYRTEGPSDAPALVFLHAIATSSALWLPQSASLASRYRVIRVDLPGHGDTPPPRGVPEYSDYADAVADLIVAQSLVKPTVVGLSFGATVAMNLAARHPQLIGALALANCAAFTPPTLAAMWRQRIAQVEANGMAGQVAGTLARWFTPAFAAGAPLTLQWVADMIEGTSPAGFVAAARMIAELDQREMLSAIACPTLVLSGAHDQATPPAIMAEIAAAIPHATIASLKAAHLANVEAPVVFTELLGEFIAQ